MDFLNRAKAGVLKASAQAAKIAREIVSPIGSSTSRLYNAELPRDVLTSLIHSVCGVIDQHAISDDAETQEGDRVLYESNAREYLRKIIDLLVDDGDRWAQAKQPQFSATLLNDASEHADEAIDTSTPCIDAFLQSNAMHEFCRRAGRDLPRGTLPMILAFISSLLKLSRYPLLPHTSIHKPMTKLIALAKRYDTVISTALKGDANYSKRVDLALTSLLNILWRKIADNPPILDFFALDPQFRKIGDNASTSVSQQATPVSMHTPQMDILAALEPHLFKPARTGQAAREALLVAISMRDARVDAFLTKNTQILQVVIAELCTQFISMSASLFVQALKIIDLIMVMSRRDQDDEGGDQIAKTTRTLYEQQFLQSCVGTSCILSSANISSEQANIAPLTNLIRYTLSELRPSSNRCSLLRSTIAFLLENSGFTTGLLLRSSSMFPAISITSMQLISAVLQVTSLEDALHFLSQRPADADEDAVANTSEQSLSTNIDIRIDNACRSGNVPRASLIVHYTDAAAHELLARISQHLLRRSGAGQLDSPCTLSDDALVLCTIKKRIAGFMSLKFDEQIALVAVVSETVSQLCTFTVLFHNGGCFLNPIVEILAAVSSLNLEISKLLKDVANVDEKLAAMTKVLTAAADATIYSQGGTPDSFKVKLLEKESPRIYRMLETGVTLKELLNQLGGYLYATMRLRSTLASSEGSFLLQQQERKEVSKHWNGGSTTMLDDDWERDIEDDFAPTEFSDLHSIESDFLQQFDAHLSTLNSLSPMIETSS